MYFPASIIQTTSSILLALYLCGLALATFEGFGVMYFAAAAIIGAISASLSFCSDTRKTSHRQRAHVVFASLLMFLPVLFSQIANLQSLTASELTTSGAFLLTLVTCSVIGATMSAAHLWNAFNLGATGFAVIILACLLLGGSDTNDRLNGFDGNMHPNYIGLMAILATCLALNRGIHLNFFVMIVSICVCIRASSRASLLAIVAAITTILICNFRTKITSSSRFISSLLGCIAATLIIVCFYGEIADLVFSQLMLSDDEHRGIGSSASGRGDTWLYCIRVWLENPFLGEGYAVTSNALEFSDGGYFLTLAETGTFGLIGVLGFIMRPVSTMLQAEFAGPRCQQRCAELALLTAFLLLNVFESRLQSGANPLSCCAYIVCFSNWSGRS